MSCEGTVCLPKALTCSFLGNPIFWLALILTVIIIVVSTYNVGKRVNGITDPILAQWLWAGILVLFFLLPTAIAALDLGTPMGDEHRQYAKCILGGFGVVLILILLQSFTILYGMKGLALTISALIILVLIWMIWLTTKLRQMIYPLLSYILFLIWYCMITYDIAARMEFS